MIVIDFLHSPDEDLLTRFQFHYDRIELGASSNSNLLINDPDWQDLSIKLQLTAQFLRLDVGETAYLLNGKKIIGSKLLSKNDQITLGNTTFKIIDFYQSEISYEKRLRDRFQEINQTYPDVAILLDGLEEELLKLQVLENQTGK